MAKPHDHPYYHLYHHQIHHHHHHHHCDISEEVGVRPLGEIPRKELSLQLSLTNLICSACPDQGGDGDDVNGDDGRDHDGDAGGEDGHGDDDDCHLCSAYPVQTKVRIVTTRQQ